MQIVKAMVDDGGALNEGCKQMKVAGNLMEWFIDLPGCLQDWTPGLHPEPFPLSIPH